VLRQHRRSPLLFDKNIWERLALKLPGPCAAPAWNSRGRSPTCRDWASTCGFNPLSQLLQPHSGGGGGASACGGIRETFGSLPGSYSGARAKENPRISALATAIMPRETTPATIISTTISRLPFARRGPLTGEVSTANGVTTDWYSSEKSGTGGTNLHRGPTPANSVAIFSGSTLGRAEDPEMTRKTSSSSGTALAAASITLGGSGELRPPDHLRGPLRARRAVPDLCGRAARHWSTMTALTPQPAVAHF